MTVVLIDSFPAVGIAACVGEIGGAEFYALVAYYCVSAVVVFGSWVLIGYYSYWCHILRCSTTDYNFYS